jgi:lipid-A-disaccharide synthase-like uncharacterized protein
MVFIRQPVRVIQSDLGTFECIVNLWIAADDFPDD